MKKAAGLSVLLLIVAVSAGSVFAAEYEHDRYERGYKIEAPPLPPPDTPASPRAVPPAPPQTRTNYGPGYFALQFGSYEPNNDWNDDLATYDAGFAFNLVFGRRLASFFAVEGSIGYFESKSDFYPGDLSVVPVTVGVRLIFPHPVVEPYIGAGVGAYFADLNESHGAINDSTADFGGYMSLGMDLWLNSRFALNMEGRYHWIKSEFDGFNIDMSGWNAFIGVRVLF